MSGQTAEEPTGGESAPTQSQDQPDFLPVTQAAKAIGVSAMTVRRLYDSQKLPGHRVGRRRQILRTFVDGYVALINTGQQPVLEDYAKTWFEQAGAVA